MSIRIMTLVWQIDLPDSEKLVLLALADNANDEGSCWPSIETLARKCSKGERTIQRCIQALKERGHLTRKEQNGKGCSYIVHPRQDDTPATVTPRQDDTPPPSPRHPTPVTVAPKPSKNRKEPSKSRRAIPDDWQPREFSAGTVCRAIIDAWPPGELEAQLEQFKANHRAKGNTFIDPQDAWQTWALNTRKFGIGRTEQKRYVSKSGYEYRGSRDQVKREAQRRGDNDTYWGIQVEERQEREARGVGQVASDILRRASQ